MHVLPATTEGITGDWLNQVLSDDVRGGAQITDVTSELIGEGVGFLGEVARLTLTYDSMESNSRTRSALNPGVT